MLLVGSKSTIADLAALRAEGWDIDLAAHVRRGGHVLGLCGGYQMLGQRIADPAGIEGAAQEVAGLGLLEVETVMAPVKHLALKSGKDLASGAAIEGYEIHIGATTGPDCARPWLELDGQREGAMSADGRLRGCYMHGIFSSDSFRAAFLAGLGGRSDLQFESGVEAALEALADHVERYMDVDLILALADEIPAPTA